MGDPSDVTGPHSPINQPGRNFPSHQLSPLLCRAHRAIQIAKLIALSCLNDTFFLLFLFYFLNYESMTTYIQQTWKTQNKVTYSSTIYYNYFLSRKIKIFSWSFNIKLSKINRMNRQKSRRMW